MPFHRIDSLLKGAAKKGGVSKQVQIALALERASQLLTRVFGSESMNEMKPVSIQYKTMTIAVIGSSAAAALGTIEEELLVYVNKGCNPPLVDRITVISA